MRININYYIGLLFYWVLLPFSIIYYFLKLFVYKSFTQVLSPLAKDKQK